VIYRPEAERYSQYCSARFPAQFDASFHIDEIPAVGSLERMAGWEAGEAPETFPSAL
jgi:hypothetical protein